jgi:hypothetical protein
MAKTNFSGPITTGPIQVNTGTTVGTNVRDAAFVANRMVFPFDFNSVAVTTDANRLATTSDNGVGTTEVTFVDTTANVPGVTSVGGFEMASAVTLTSSGNDSALTATLTGTDILGNSQTEGITMANAGVVTTTKTWKTVTETTVSGAGTVGTLEMGVLATAQVSVLARSLFNENPLTQTSSTTGSDKNLANNIVIPPFSRITDIRLNNSVAWANTTYVEIGTNVAQAAGATLNSLELDYFAGDAATDVKAIGSHHVPLYLKQTAAQQDSCLNVSDGDASGYEIDKAIVITWTSGTAAPSAGNSYLVVDWLQKANKTN